MKAQSLVRYHHALVIGIDLAKRKHVAVALSPCGTFSRPFSFYNSRSGFEALAVWMEKCQQKHRVEAVVIGFESTSHYGRALESWLVGKGLELRVVSTLNTKRAKEMMDNSPLKSDAKDAAVIAELVQQGKSRRYYQREELFENLRGLSELYRRLGQEAAAARNRLHRTLDHLFPELLGLFSDVEGKAVQALLKTAPTPEEVLSLGLEALTELLVVASNRRIGKEKAQAVWEAAQVSIACTKGVAAQRLELPFLLNLLEALRCQRMQVERDMTALLEQVEYAPKLLTVPGLGKVTLAVVLGEVGDLRSYQNARQVLKMAGLNLYEKSSGLHQGQQRVTKRGRSYLRCVLYLAAVRMMKKDGLLHPYKLRHQHKAGPKLLVAGMRKLVEVLFALARDNRAYENRVIEFKPVEKAVLELSA